MADSVVETDIQKSAAPYRPSWIDRLIRWIDRLRGPAWLFYGLGTLALALLINGILWIDGSVPYGAPGSIQGIYPPFVFYLLALYHYLTRIGSRSLLDFQPLLDVDDAELAQRVYELSTLPRRLGWLAIALGFGLTPPYLAGDPIAFGELAPLTALPYVVAVGAAGFFGATFFCVVLRSMRQLRMVHELHRQAADLAMTAARGRAPRRRADRSYLRESSGSG